MASKTKYAYMNYTVKGLSYLRWLYIWGIFRGRGGKGLEFRAAAYTSYCQYVPYQRAIKGGRRGPSWGLVYFLMEPMSSKLGKEILTVAHMSHRV